MPSPLLVTSGRATQGTTSKPGLRNGPGSAMEAIAVFGARTAMAASFASERRSISSGVTPVRSSGFAGLFLLGTAAPDDIRPRPIASSGRQLIVTVFSTCSSDSRRLNTRVKLAPEV